MKPNTQSISMNRIENDPILAASHEAFYWALYEQVSKAESFTLTVN